MTRLSSRCSLVAMRVQQVAKLTYSGTGTAQYDSKGAWRCDELHGLPSGRLSLVLCTLQLCFYLRNVHFAKRLSDKWLE